MGYQASGANGTGSPRTFTLYVSCYRDRAKTHGKGARRNRG